MRGCLSVIVLALVFAVAGAWFAGPPVAAFVVQTGLSAAGFQGSNTSVTVVADPPVELLSAHADRVTIESEDATIDQFRAGRVELALTDADLLNRTFGSVEGSLDNVTIEASGDTTLEASRVEVTGDPSAADMTIHVTREALGNAALEMLRQQLGVEVDTVKFAAPDKVSFTAGGTTIAGQFVIHDGGLSMMVNLPGAQRIDLLEAGRGFTLTKVSIGDREMVLDGVLDVQHLLS
jgi:hypothetical protein